MRASSDHARIERGVGSAGRVERRRAREIRDPREPDRAGERQPADGDRHLDAVHESQALFGLERDRPDPGLFERARRAEDPAPAADEALPRQAEREMRERSQITGGADGPLFGNERENVRREQVEEPLHGRDADARPTLRERVGAQSDHRPHRFVGERIPDPGGVASDEVLLELEQPVARDGHLGETSEARRDPVHPVAPRDRALDRLAGSGHRAPRHGSERDADPPAGDVLEVGEGQAAPGEEEAFHGMKLSALT